MSPTHRRIECKVTGRVQMVMFRDFVRRGALALGITGFVRNNTDGSVAVLAEGEEQRLKALLSRMSRGSLLSRVDRVETAWSGATGEYKDFTIVIS